MSVIGASASIAVAQNTDEAPDRILGLDGTSVGISPQLLAPVDVVEGPGVKVGEGTAVYPTLGADTGFVSNVFYQDTDTLAAGILRLLAQVGTGSLNKVRLQPPTPGEKINLGTFQHREELRLTYDFYLSGNDYVADQDSLGILATLRGAVYPGQTVSFLYLDAFERSNRSPNFESSNQINRDINRLFLGVQYAPAGRSIRALFRFTNTLDLFERQEQRFANRMQNALGLTVAWRLRPVTVAFADVSQGFYLGIGSATAYANAKENSFPLLATVGLQTLLSLKTSIVGRVGYANGFYDGPSYSTVAGGVDLGWRYSPMGRATLMYEYLHDDSINANFYRDHRIMLAIVQGFVPFQISVVPEMRLRRYEGVLDLIPTAPTDVRDDFIFATTVAARYNFRDRYAAVLQYRFSTLQTDFRYMSDGEIDDPSYARHELFLGFRAGL